MKYSDQLEGDSYNEMLQNFLSKLLCTNLKASSSSNQEFADIQTGVLDAQIEVIKLMEDQSKQWDKL